MSDTATSATVTSGAAISDTVISATVVRVTVISDTAGECRSRYGVTAISATAMLYMRLSAIARRCYARHPAVPRGTLDLVCQGDGGHGSPSMGLMFVGDGATLDAGPGAPLRRRQALLCVTTARKLHGGIRQTDASHMHSICQSDAAYPSAPLCTCAPACAPAHPHAHTTCVCARA